MHLLPEGQWPSTAATLGANTVLLQVASTRRPAGVVVVAALDNLTKGTAGAAVQCLNLALGLPETTGPADRWSGAMTDRPSRASASPRPADSGPPASPPA